MDRLGRILEIASGKDARLDFSERPGCTSDFWPRKRITLKSPGGCNSASTPRALLPEQKRKTKNWIKRKNWFEFPA